jgi:hypothetical protein
MSEDAAKQETSETLAETPATLAPATLIDAAIDSPTTEQPITATIAPQESAIATTGAEWSWAEGVNGEGEKPEWLKERYKSVADQAKAYTELEKKMGEFKGAPKDGYTLDSLEGINADDPLISHFRETFKDLNLSQKGFDRIATEFAQLQQQQATVAIEEEIKKMGPNAKQRIKETVSRIDNKFTPEVAQTIKGWLITAGDFDAFDGLLASEPRSTAPTYDQAYQQPDYESVKEVLNEKETNWKRYKEDENYRKSVSKRLHTAHAREKSMKK